MLHGIAVFVAHIDARALQGEIGEAGCIVESGEHEFGNAMLVRADDERLINLSHSLDGVEVVGEDITECVFESVGRELWGVVIGNGIEVIVGHIGGLQLQFMEDFDDFGRVGNHFESTLLGGFLLFVVAMEEIDDVGEGGCGNVVEECCDALLHVVCEMPDDEPHSDAVLIAGVVKNVQEMWKVCVFASAVHAYALEPLHGGCVCNALHEGGNVGVIDGEKHEE